MFAMPWVSRSRGKKSNRLFKAAQRRKATLRAAVEPLEPRMLLSTITWSGAGDGTSWNSTANWTGAVIPGASDTALFTNTGTSGKTINLNANETISQLQISSTNGFTIGNSSQAFTLTLTTLNQVSQTGQGNMMIACPIALAANSTWTVDGSNTMTDSKAISGSYTLTKLGSADADVQRRRHYTGTTTVSAGKLIANVTGSIAGSVVVGGGASSATFTTGNTSSAIADGASITVNSNGTASFGANSETFNNLTINGGTFTNAACNINGTITMTGGRSTAFTASTATTPASRPTPTPPTAECDRGSVLANANITYNVADGGASIDFDKPGGDSGGGASYSISKSGAGVMVVGDASTQSDATFNITGGTLLFDNTSGSGTGPATAVVGQASSNATLGGTGTIGGVCRLHRRQRHGDRQRLVHGHPGPRRHQWIDRRPRHRHVHRGSSRRTTT